MEGAKGAAFRPQIKHLQASSKSCIWESDANVTVTMLISPVCAQPELDESSQQVTFRLRILQRSQTDKLHSWFPGGSRPFPVPEAFEAPLSSKRTRKKNQETRHSLAKRSSGVAFFV